MTDDRASFAMWIHARIGENRTFSFAARHKQADEAREFPLDDAFKILPPRA